MQSEEKSTETELERQGCQVMLPLSALEIDISGSVPNPGDTPYQ